MVVFLYQVNNLIQNNHFELNRDDVQKSGESNFDIERYEEEKREKVTLPLLF